MPSYPLRKILILTSACFLILACSRFGTKSDGGKAESLSDIKKRLWLQATPDQAVSLRTVSNFEIYKRLPIARPGSFLISDDSSFYINDNTNGNLFKVSPDFQSIKEFGKTLSYPTRIREFDSKIFVYDNRGINVFHRDGQFVKTVKPFLKLEDFDLLPPDSYIASLAERSIDNDGSYFAVLDSAGKRLSSIGKLRLSNYPDIENRAFVEARDGSIYVGYKFEPASEVYDVRSRVLINAFQVTSKIFPDLLSLKQDKKFTNPEPGVYRIGRFIAGFKVLRDRFYVLLHTPNPVIVEFSLEGKELRRYISRETQAEDYFGFDVQLKNDARQFFVGTIDYSSNSNIVVYEEYGT